MRGLLLGICEEANKEMRIEEEEKVGEREGAWNERRLLLGLGFEKKNCIYRSMKKGELGFRLGLLGLGLKH